MIDFLHQIERRDVMSSGKKNFSSVFKYVKHIHEWRTFLNGPLSIYLQF